VEGGYGIIEAHAGALWHDWGEAFLGASDATVQDYALSLVAIDLGSQVASGDLSAHELANAIRDPAGPLGLDGPGSNGLVGFYQNTWPLPSSFLNLNFNPQPLIP
jgi:hypothetical protein